MEFFYTFSKRLFVKICQRLGRLPPPRPPASPWNKILATLLYVHEHTLFWNDMSAALKKSTDSINFKIAHQSFFSQYLASWLSLLCSIGGGSTGHSGSSSSWKEEMFGKGWRGDLRILSSLSISSSSYQPIFGILIFNSVHMRVTEFVRINYTVYM